MKHVKHSLLCLCVAASLFPTLGATEVYKQTDSKGRVIYSDQPLDDATVIKIAPINTQDATPPLSSNQTYELPDAAAPNYQIKIASPSSEKFIPVGNANNLKVTVHVNPQLATHHALRLLLNGLPIGEPQAQGVFYVQNLINGQNSLQVIAVTKEDLSKIISESEKIYIYTKKSFIQNQESTNAIQMPRAPQAPLAPRL